MHRSFPELASEGQWIYRCWCLQITDSESHCLRDCSVASQLLARHEVKQSSFLTVNCVRPKQWLTPPPFGIFVDYIFFLFFGLYLFRIWFFKHRLVGGCGRPGQNCNWWAKAWSSCPIGFQFRIAVVCLGYASCSIGHISYSSSSWFTI